MEYLFILKFILLSKFYYLDRRIRICWFHAFDLKVLFLKVIILEVIESCMWHIGDAVIINFTHSNYMSSFSLFNFTYFFRPNKAQK
jgi:hypothetical protein